MTSLPTSYKWYKESELAFNQGLNSHDILDKTRVLVERIKSYSSSVTTLQCEEVIDDVNKIFIEVANKSLVKIKKKKNNRIMKQKWFDDTCHDLKGQVRELSNLVSKKPFNKRIRETFF